MTTTFSESINAGLDANSTSTVTDTLDIKANREVVFEVYGESGTHATHVVTLQKSLDGTNWTNTSNTQNQLGILNNIQVTARYVRCKVTTAEGGASSIKIIVQAK